MMMEEGSCTYVAADDMLSGGLGREERRKEKTETNKEDIWQQQRDFATPVRSLYQDGGGDGDDGKYNIILRVWQ